MRFLLVAFLASVKAAAIGWTHGWDCIACKTNSMLVSNFGTWRRDINMSDPWWITTIAESHHAIILNNFHYQGLQPGSYNGTGEENRIPIARALKKVNPAIKVMYYQAADRVCDNAYCLNTLAAHPEWWLRDDFGNVVAFGGRTERSPPFPGPRPVIDLSVEAAQDWVTSIVIEYFKVKGEASALLDGLMVDGVSYFPTRYKNLSLTSYEKYFAGMMRTMAKMQAAHTANSGGQVWANPLLEYGVISPTGGPQPKGAHWNSTLGPGKYAGAFDEMFGSFGTSNPNGTWDAEKMRISFESIINASAAGKTVVIHAFPGPAGYNDPKEGMFPTRGPPGNQFKVAAWHLGPDAPSPVPESADECRAASQSRLVESLAPFLIVVSERVFFGYGWFYDLEDGYIPCPAHIECGMPNEWFAEYGRPLGPPNGPAITDAEKNVWRREFQHASVYVDVRNRTASSITWH